MAAGIVLVREAAVLSPTAMAAKLHLTSGGIVVGNEPFIPGLLRLLVGHIATGGTRPPQLEQDRAPRHLPCFKGEFFLLPRGCRIVNPN